MAEPPVEAFKEAVRSAYLLARGERLGELRARRSRLLDDRGLHPFSLDVGRIEALREMWPDELREYEWDPVDVRNAAAKEAALMFEEETALRVAVSHGWISPEQAEALRRYPLEDTRRRSRDKRRADPAHDRVSGP